MNWLSGKELKMNSTAREHIFARLRAAAGRKTTDIPIPEGLPTPTLDRNAKIELVKARQEAVKSEVHLVRSDTWTQTLKKILRSRKAKTLLYAPEIPLGKTITAAWQGASDDLPVLTPYEGDIEDFKPRLFGIDAGITSTKGAIAETGALILWPDALEPRLMSLVPPIHIAVVGADQIYATFNEAMEKGAWAENMPTNALLISGPSKTADIELVIAFGVHGPKELIILILQD
jgi:L-lactate dehydrogenase complex protein LldG